MDEGHLDIISNQKSTWNKYAGGWQKWDQYLQRMFGPVTDEVLYEAQVMGSEDILDVACGTGEPGMTLAGIVPNGKVTGVDISEEMIAFASEQAKKKGLDNYDCLVVEGINLPFDDNTFDQVICRFGIMFFPDLVAGVKEMVRVLKPGGKLVVAVWAAQELNPFLTLLSMTVAEELDLPLPTPDAPGPFRCAQPNFTTQILEEAGLTGCRETNIPGKAIFDSAEHFWKLSFEVAGPIVDILNQQSLEVVERIKQAVIDKASEKIIDQKLIADWEAIVAVGQKPE